MLDSVAKEKLYLEYRPKVQGYIASRVHNTGDIEDLVSAVFYKVYKNLHRYDSGKASISTWIFTITRNTVIDYFKNPHITSPLDDREVSEDNVEDTLLREELLDSLASALEGLEERERDIIVLHYYNRKTLADIAAMMQISYSYAKVLHKKAIGALKEALC